MLRTKRCFAPLATERCGNASYAASGKKTEENWQKMSYAPATRCERNKRNKKELRFCKAKLTKPFLRRNHHPTARCLQGTRTRAARKVYVSPMKDWCQLIGKHHKKAHSFYVLSSSFLRNWHYEGIEVHILHIVCINFACTMS